MSSSYWNLLIPNFFCIEIILMFMLCEFWAAVTVLGQSKFYVHTKLQMCSSVRAGAANVVKPSYCHGMVIYLLNLWRLNFLLSTLQLIIIPFFLLVAVEVTLVFITIPFLSRFWCKFWPKNSPLLIQIPISKLKFSLFYFSYI